MKRTDLIRHLEAIGSTFVREGGNHTIYRNTVNDRHSTVPRHRHLKEGLVRKFCRGGAGQDVQDALANDLGIPAP